jgi:photosystem II stability/assembly factor-like uncharacterized protein
MRNPVVHLPTIIAAILALAGNAASAGDSIPLSQLHERTHFHGIAVDPMDPSRLYLATHHGLFVVGADGMAMRLSPVLDFMGFTPSPVDPAIFYASGHPAGGGNLGFVMSNDGGANWTQLSAGVGGPVDFHQMDVSPADGNVVYGVYGGVQVSHDGGRTWTMSGPAPEGLIQLAASSTAIDRLYAGTKVGLSVSDDRGASWRDAGFGTEIVSMVHAAPRVGLYAFVVGRGLLRAAENDLSKWTPLGGDLGDRIILHLALDRTDANRLYAITYDGDVIASADGGHSWHRFAAP